MERLVAPAASESAGGFAQLVNLRTFRPRFLVPERQPCTPRPQHRRHARARGVAPDVADLLRSSQPLVAAASPPAPLTVDTDQLPEVEDWHRHPELLQGQVPPPPAASRRCLRPSGLSCACAPVELVLMHILSPRGQTKFSAACHPCLQVRARRRAPAGGGAAQRRRGQQPGAAPAQGGGAPRHSILPAGAVHTDGPNPAASQAVIVLPATRF